MWKKIVESKRVLVWCFAKLVASAVLLALVLLKAPDGVLMVVAGGWTAIDTLALPILLGGISYSDGVESKMAASVVTGS